MDLSTERLHSVMPLGATLGLELSRPTATPRSARLPWAAHLTTAGGALHGGTLMALADSLGGVVAFLNLPEGAGTSTISSSTVFVRVVREGVVTATARLVHRGRSTIVVETELTDEAGRTLARTTQTQAVLLR